VRAHCLRPLVSPACSTHVLTPTPCTQASWRVVAAGSQSASHTVGLLTAVSACVRSGDDEVPLALPPVFKVDPPFGADVGGTNPAFWTFKPEAQYDSWLTVAITDGAGTEISSIGVDFTKWCAAAAPVRLRGFGGGPSAPCPCMAAAMTGSL
jgi:hypothetical protein